MTGAADYQESLDYLYGLQRFGIKLGLENIRTLLSDLRQPQQRFRVVHVGGTNGKGSVAACTAEILRRSGYRVGLYTSPHLHSFTERIRVNGRPIPEREVVRLTEFIRGRTSLRTGTFFEFTTAMAMLWFAWRRVDFAVLEVGMGGRLDATNVVDPEVSVVTTVCRDHAEHLGGDLATIAGEKAGILKEGVAAVIGAQQAEAAEVLAARARAVGAPAFFYGRDFFIRPAPGGFSFSGMGLELADLRPGLPGAHQHRNLSLALAAAQALRRQGTDLPQQALRDGVARVRWPGRLEWWRGGREVLLDGAHNPGGAKALADYLDGSPKGDLRWVVGCKADKAVEEILAPLLPRRPVLYCTRPPVEAAADPRRLANLGRQFGCAAGVFENTDEAMAAALEDRREDDIVLVAGSLFLVAAAREYLRRRESDSS